MVLINLFRLGRRLGIAWRHVALIWLLQLLVIVFEGAGLGLLLVVLYRIQSDASADGGGATDGLLGQIDDALESLSIDPDTLTLVIIVFLAILLRQITVFSSEVFTSWRRYREIQNATQSLFEKCIGANLSYFDREKFGSFINDLLRETENAVSNILLIATLFSGILVLTFYMAIAIVNSPMLTALAFVLFAVLTWVVRWTMRATRRNGFALTAGMRLLTARLVERIRAIRLIRLAGTERLESSQFAELNAHLRNVRLKGAVLRSQISLIVEPAAAAFGLAVIYLGVTQFGISLATMAIFLAIILRLFPLVRRLMGNYQNLVGAEASVRALIDRLETLEADRDIAFGNRPSTPPADRISVDGVHYGYDGAREAPALRGVTVDIPARAVTAIVGPSGAGKSTLVDLLVGLRQPDQGTVSIDGTPLVDFEAASLRRSIAFMPQSAMIFDGTVADHICYGRGTIPPAALETAARAASAHAFIADLPQGYQTPVGEVGSRLSAGQRQRLDLARVLNEDASIIVLDEPTANLDALSEGAIRDALHALKEDRQATVVVIAHRLSTVVEADRIIVLRDGVVDGVGTHGELVASNDWYREAFAVQSAGAQGLADAGSAVDPVVLPAADDR